MQIDVLLFPQANYEEILREKIVVVLDILRATSSIVTALGNKASMVIPAIEVEDVEEFKKIYSSGEIITGGERKGLKIQGFDLGNSPLEYSEAKVSGKTIILCTTNGARAICWAQHARDVLIGSYLNLQAVVSHIKNESRDIVLVCSGREGNLSLEDLACAGMIVQSLANELPDLKKTDGAMVAMYAGEQSVLTDLKEFISQTEHGRYLTKIGMVEDLRHCSTLNMFNIVPKFNEGCITL